MKKCIVTTTINPPTEAVLKYDAMPEWELIVAGDRKTPGDYTLSRGTYLSPQAQEAMDPALSDAIGWNCIQRRNFALLEAYKRGADIVAVIDDDNIPLNDWGKNLIVGGDAKVNFYNEPLPAFDPVGLTNHGAIWHRGYPLQLLSKRHYATPEAKMMRVDIQADFWNGDPDIDAICRMEHAPECTFDPKYFPVAANKPAPFNSQNTFLSRHVLKDYFLCPQIGRMDDIWAAYYVQAKGYTVAFGTASVYQKRNQHDFIVDMKAEYLGYENNLNLIEQLAMDPETIHSFLPDSANHAWKLYRMHFNN